MSCKLITKQLSPLVRPLLWPALSAVPVVEVQSGASPELDHARQALVHSSEEAEELHQRVDELERALETREGVGYEKGFAEGQIKGRKESAEELNPVIERLSRAIADAAMIRARLRMESESDLIQLCTAIAHRILKREIHMDPLALEGILQAALARAGAVEIFKIRAHPAHTSALRTQLSKLGVPESVRVEAVASLDEGDLFIETSVGEIDASINTQIGEVERGLAAPFSA